MDGAVPLELQYSCEWIEDYLFEDTNIRRKAMLKQDASHGWQHLVSVLQSRKFSFEVKAQAVEVLSHILRADEHAFKVSSTTVSQGDLFASFRHSYLLQMQLINTLGP